MAGKSIEQFGIPENETDENVSNLVEQIHQISPIFYDARIDDREYNRVITYSLSLDEAYRRLLRESETTEALENCTIYHKDTLNIFKRKMNCHL